jgi:Xaa-Pro aminopeptidase
MEVYENADKSITAIVDYAHNRMSFENLFTSVRQEYPGRKVAIVFGCPGNKAQNRRKDLGEISGKYADMIYITEEDPGEEPVQKISREIADFVEAENGKYKIIDDRGEAISTAINEMGANSVILITGKGNETRQKRGIEYIDCPTDVEYATKALKEYDKATILVQPSKCNVAAVKAISKEKAVFRADSPVAKMKAVKNAVEIEGFKRAMLSEGVAMVKLLKWLRPAVEQGGVTELDVDRKLTELRSADENFRGLSFSTIAAYGANGAIVHYEPTPQENALLEPKGFLLLDCGAQYSGGTTDITRTIPLGSLTDEERADYTLVLRGHISLAMAKFPKGTCGTQLDVLARQWLWQAGENYLHGTGHGVGHFLNVHEGPHQIRMNNMPAHLLPGMTVTNEPGLYKAGRHGIRIENTMLVNEFRETEFGPFYGLEPLTICPIDTAAIVPELLGNDARAYTLFPCRESYGTQSCAPCL